MAADFIVGLEVQPRGAGLRQAAAQTKVLTDETRKSGEENRRAAAANTELERAERRRAATEADLTRSTKAQTSALGDYHRALVVAATAAAAMVAVAITRAILQQASAYEQLRIQLRTVTGSAESAASAFEMIKRFAVATPFEVSNITAAFVRLKAVGIEPTEALLRSLGDTASAFGRDITDFTAAVISATAGEMESLKSFGVVARVQGDQVKFTFQGVTTQIHRDSQSIVGYLKMIGDTKFAGGMERQAKSMQGAISNVKDAFAAFADAVGRAGVTEAIAHLAATITATFSGTAEAARTFGSALAAAVKLLELVFSAVVKGAWLLVAVVQVLMALKVASWFLALANAIAVATGATVTFKGALSSLAVAGPLAAIGIALLAVIVLMERYILTTRAAHAAEMEKVTRSNELFGYYQTLRANKIGLTEAEAAYAVEVRKTMEAERAALVVALQRAKAEAVTRQFAPAAGFAPSDTARQERVKDLEREVQTIDNLLNGLEKEWDRLGKLPTIKLPVDTGEVDKAAKKLADLLAGFQRTAEQAERIQAEQASGGASGVARVTAEIERQNAAYQALHSLEGVSAAAKAKLTGIIEGLVGRTQAANRATAEGAAETARDLTYTNAAIEAEARLADAKSQTSAASREAAIQTEADTIARSEQREEDSAYVAGLLRVIRVREDYLAGVALEIAAVERQIAHSATLRQKRAEVADAQAQDTAATRRLTIELEAETEARARGVQIGTIWHQLLLAISATRAQEIAVLDQQSAAQRRLNEVETQRARARAEFTDWNRQRDAAAAYGTEIAGILGSYGLLSEATRELTIREEALAAFREAGNTRTLEQIEAELRGYAAVEESLARVAAATEMQAYVVEPVRAEWARLGETLQSAVIDRLIDGQIEAEDIGKALLRSMLHAIAEMLKRWILAHRAMQAEAMRTAAVNAAAAQAGGGGGAGIGTNLGGGFGSWGAGGGGAAGGLSATAVGAGATVAIFAAIYFGVSQWIKTNKDQVASVTFRLQEEVGGAVFDIKGNSDNVKKVTDAIHGAGKAVVDWLRSIGGAIEGASSGAVSVWREGQGKNTSWFVQVAGGVKEWFRSQEEAFSFAMVEALRAANITGLSPIVAAAIKNNVFRTMEELQSGIADALKVASFGESGAGAEMRAVSAEMDRLRASMREMIGTGAELADALNRINAQEILLVQSQRDAITGKVRTAEEEYQMHLLEMRAWNAQREMRLSLIAVDIARTKAEIAAYGGTKLLINGGGGGGGAGAGDGGLMGLGRTFLWLAGVTSTATEIMTSSGDAGLDALNAYLKSLQDLYDALKAIPPITPEEVPQGSGQRPGAGGGAGGGQRQARIDLLAEVESWKLTDVGKALQDATAWFSSFKASLKDMGFTAAQQAAIMVAATEELARRQQEIKAAQLSASRDFINAGTAAGGPLIKSLDDNRKTQLALIAANRDLQKQGLLSQREMRELNRAIHEAGVRQRDQMIGSAADQLFADLYQLLGDEEAAAQLRFDLTLAELDLRREELRLAMLTAGYTEERMRAILEPLGILIQRVREAGPAIFGPGAGAGGAESQGPAGKVWSHGRWVSANEGGGGASSAVDRMREANELLASYRDQGRNEYDVARSKVEADFAIIRAALGNTAEVADQFGAAMGRLRTQFLEGVREVYDSLSLSQFSPLEQGDRLALAQQEFAAGMAAIRLGDWSQVQSIATRAQAVLQEAQAALPTGSQAYFQIFSGVKSALAELLGKGTAPGSIPEASFPTSPSNNVLNFQGPVAPSAGAPAVNLGPVVTELRTGSTEVKVELRGIRQATEDSRAELRGIRGQLDAGIKIAGGVN